MRNISIAQRIFIFAVLIAIITAALPRMVFAGDAGFFSQVEGRVDILKEGAKTPVLVSRGDIVSTGDIVRTKIDSRAEIIFRDETSVRLAPESRIKIDEYIYNPDNSRKNGTVSLLRGKMRAVVSKTGGGIMPAAAGRSTFNVQTPTAVAGVRGTTIFVFYQYGVTGVIFKDGSGFILNPNGCAPSSPVNINDGQVSFVTGECTPPLPARNATDAEISRHTADVTLTDTEGGGGIEAKGDQELMFMAGAGLVLPGSDGGGDIFGYTAPQDDIAVLSRLSAEGNVDTGNAGLLSVSEENPELLSNNMEGEDTGSLPVVEQDNTPPVVTLEGPSGTTNLSKAAFLVTSSEPVTIQYKVDQLEGVITGVISDTINLEALPEGDHTLTITATDAAGNLTTMTYSWTTDYTPPEASIITSPSLVTNSSSASFDFAASEDVSYSFNLDSRPVVATNFSELSEGNHTLTVTAVDEAGNISVTGYTWEVDKTAPHLSISSAPPEITNSGTAIFSHTINEEAGLSFVLDGHPVAEPVFRGLTEGSHTFNVIATDAAGNESALSYTWNVDYTAPIVTINTVLALITNSGSASFTQTSNDDAILSFVLDGLPADKSSFSGLSEGSHTFTVTATDAAGNVSSSSFTWTTDYTAPEIAINAAPGALTNMDSASFVMTSSEDAVFSYVLDDRSVDSLSFGGLSEGDHTFAVTATDAAGNASFSSYDWTTDYTAPASSFTDMPVEVNDSAEAEFDFVSNDSSATFSYRIDGGVWMSSDGNVSLESPADYTEGLHTLDLMTTDPAGNSSTASYTWFYGAGHYNLTGLAAGMGPGTPAVVSGDLYMQTEGNQGGWLSDLSGLFSGALPASWQIVSGGSGYDDSDGWNGYWLSEISGTSSASALSGTSHLTYLTETSLGTGSGTVSGIYDNVSGVWQAADLGLGTYRETPLTFMSPLSLDTRTDTVAYYGSGYYDDGGSYSYAYYENNSYGYFYYSRPGMSASSTYYFRDGSMYTYDPDAENWISGTWDPSTFDLSTLAEFPDPSGIQSTSVSSDPISDYTGTLTGYLGGTQSLWDNTDIPVTVLGELEYFNLPGIWSGEISSYNAENDTETTYDGGAYYGVMAGMKDGANNMEGMTYALYVDPEGSAGYLRGEFSGFSSPDIQMFEMDGTVNHTEIVSNTSIEPGDISNSVREGWGYGYISGTYTGNTGSITAGSDELVLYSIVDYQNGIAQPWGIFYQVMNGQFETPGTDWSAKMGGYGSFDVINPYMMHYGNYGYSDGGSYYYSYYSNDSYGYKSYYRPGGEYYYVQYNSDGTTYTYDYTTNTRTSGTWAPSDFDLSSLATPPDVLNATLDYTYIYPGGKYEEGYWLTSVSNGTWANDKLSGTISGRYMTPYRIGDITGDVLGIYNDDVGTWQATAMGAYTGSTPLAFSDSFYGDYYNYYSWWDELSECDCTFAGIFGTTVSPFAEPGLPRNLYLMGTSDTHQGYMTWWDDVDGSDYVDIESKWEGFISGITKQDNQIQGMMNALYVDSSGNAGILSGQFNGTDYPDISVWEGEGTLTADQKATGYDSADLWSYLNVSSTDDHLDGELYGHFEGETGYLESGDDLEDIDDDTEDTEVMWFTNPETEEDEPWGIYRLVLGGYFDNPENATTFSIDVGGNDWKDVWSTVWRDFWVAHITGNWNSDQTLDGFVTGTYLTPYALGSISGSILGSYSTDSEDTWEAVTMGEFAEVPLAFSSYFYDHYYYLTDDYWLDYDYWDSIRGILGTTSSPFLYPGEEVSLYLMGEANPDYYNNHTLWWANVSGNEYVDTVSMWNGWLGGFTGRDDIVKGVMNGLYVDSTGGAGILLGNFTGQQYSDALDVWEARGGLTAIEMASEYSAGSFSYITCYPDSYIYDSLRGGFGSYGWGIYSDDGYLQDQNEEMGYDISQTRRFENEPWGIFQLAFGGDFDNKPYGSAPFTIEIKGGREWFSSGWPYSDMWGNYTEGNWNENNTIEGKTYGYIADTSSPEPTTWISVGDTLGTYNPDAGGAYGTWQAVQMGVFLETNTFLVMTQTAEGQARLNSLNIPYAEVGRATLTGSGNNFTNLSMEDTIFFAYNNGEAPKIWATGNVNGTFTAAPALHNSALLTGDGLSADFIIRQWDTGSGKWRSEIRGSGGFNGSSYFTGAGAGTIDNEAATISGTAAGITK